MPTLSKIEGQEIEHAHKSVVSPCSPHVPRHTCIRRVHESIGRVDVDVVARKLPKFLS